MRRDLTVVIVFRFLQLAAVGEEDAPPRRVVRQVGFVIFQNEGDFRSGEYVFVHLRRIIALVAVPAARRATLISAPWPVAAAIRRAAVGPVAAGIWWVPATTAPRAVTTGAVAAVRSIPAALPGRAAAPDLIDSVARIVAACLIQIPGA